jgi:hypothetical protein
MLEKNLHFSLNEMAILVFFFPIFGRVSRLVLPRLFDYRTASWASNFTPFTILDCERQEFFRCIFVGLMLHHHLAQLQQV